MGASGRIYLSGPMTGQPDHNFPAFHAAARRFAQAGWQVANPADNFGGRTDLPRESYLRADVVMLAQCNAIALLSGWRESRGARLECLLAGEMGLDAYDGQTGRLCQELARAWAAMLHSSLATDLSEPVLDAARRITTSDRQDDYGHPAEDFARTARMWTGILDAKLREGAEISAMDVPLCMIAVKLARQAHRHKRDNLVDIAGYARTAAMVAGEE